MQAGDTLFTMQRLGLARRARPLLRAIDWQWQAGQHWAVLGPNGAGKSTLGAVLAGEERHFSGQLSRGPALAADGVAYVCFERARRLVERDRKLDCAEFESAAFDPGTRVRDLLPAHAVEREDVIDLLGLAPILDRGLRFVSTGEMRRTLLASAILQRPALMILDSPLDGLDRRIRSQLRRVLDTLIAASRATLVLCRDPDDVPRACSHVMLLGDGRCLLKGQRETVLASDACRQLTAPPAIALGAPPEPPSTLPAGNAPGIELRGVSVTYGSHCVFRDVDWVLGRDRHCLISGPNGCGKSTLLDLLTGDNHKAYGQHVALFGRLRGSGESVWDIKALFGRVDARMQFAFPAGSSVLQVVCSGFFDSLGLYERPGDRRVAAARAWLDSLGLGDRAGDDFHALSFGLQRLVLLARAMVKNPAFLLLDEATLSLDRAHRRLMIEAIDHVVDAGGSQLLFVSHSPDDLPRCINQSLTFTPHPAGSTVAVVDAPPAAQSSA
jgi:molybdate transport system ATP-binding protein